jgi:2-polyprenyl-3-methyl-5-hydroxy-6-metoxy-1,4-benzoquinol methylase
LILKESINLRQATASDVNLQPRGELSLREDRLETAVKAGCLLCGGVLRVTANGLFDTRFGIDGTYTVAECRECALEQIAPVPTAAELKTLYEGYYNFGGRKGTRYEKIREKFLSSLLYQMWIRIDGDISFHGRRGHGRLLDIGCNEGRSLKIYKRNGFEVEGLELNENAAAVARSAGFPVYTNDLSEFRPAEPYDIVVLSNVLEHARDPRQMLQDIGRILKRDGQVWISCPNGRSWLRKAFGSAWINWHVPFHISHFTAGTSQEVLQQAGFVVLEARQITPALWVSSSVIARLFAKKAKPTRQLRNPVLMLGLMLLSRGLLFPVLWLGNVLGRGDCLLTVATKS